MKHLFGFPVHLLLVHGYSALFIWSILEGEIGLMLAGWLASKHLVFTYEKVLLVAIAGAIIGDVATFTFGRLFEKRALAWLNNHPKSYQIAQEWLQRWGGVVIVFERFIYGTHIPVLLSLGMSGYGFIKFLLFDIVGVILWALTFVSIGYYFGQNTIHIILFIQKNIFVVCFFIAIFLVLIKFKGDR